jgi:hypothetical protein
VPQARHKWRAIFMTRVLGQESTSARMPRSSPSQRCCLPAVIGG